MYPAHCLHRHDGGSALGVCCLASVVFRLDVAVAEAYGWPNTLPDAEILLRLNRERAREEQAVRYPPPNINEPSP